MSTQHASRAILLCAALAAAGHSARAQTPAKPSAGAVQKPAALGAPIINKAAFPVGGQEILLEIFDSLGHYTPGIYAWAPAETKVQQRPRLLIAGGHNPVWSPGRTRFLFTFAGDVCLADLKGEAAPLMPVPPGFDARSKMRWPTGGAVIIPALNSGVGTRSLLANISEDHPVDKMSYNGFALSSASAQVLLKKPAHGDGPVAWNDMLTLNNMSLAPDGKGLVAEVYPMLPDGLGRSQSRLRTFKMVQREEGHAGEVRQTTPAEREQMQWFVSDGVVSPFEAPGKNLPAATGLIQTSPLWSPQGDWIAFTGIDTLKATVLPYVIRPDGSGLKSLVQRPPTASMLSSTTAWGDPHITPLEWSADGKFLWLQEGDGPGANLSIARQEAGQWKVTYVEASTDSNLGMLHWAFNGPRVAWVEAAYGDKNLSVQTVDSQGEKTALWYFNRGVEVLNMDW